MNRLAVVVGHQKDKKGALAVGPINAYEYDYNTEIAQIMFRYAKSFGLECEIFFRDNCGLVGAYNKVHNWAGDDNTVCIELHFNAADGKARGSEVLFDNDPADSIEFAREIHNTICNVFNRTGKQNRGIKPVEAAQRGETNLRLCRITSCLVEPFFGDNKEDAALGYAYKFEYAKNLVLASMRFLSAREFSRSVDLV